jgi:hypothetical protein
MFAINNRRTCALVCATIFLAQPFAFRAHADSNTTKPVTGKGSEVRDGQHDFDFEMGTWKVHISRLQHPLTGSNTWVQYDGTFIARKVLGGAANTIELSVSGPAGHIEGLSLQLYDPKSHQWSLTFASSGDDILDPSTIGEFKDGRGEFFDQEPFNGRMILLRKVWVNMPPNSGRFEEAYSDDGGKTWETNWIATETRI